MAAGKAPTGLAMIKLSVFLTRRADLTHEEFSRYWLNVHAPFLEKLPEVQQYVRRYVQQDATASLPQGLPIASFDGVAELWFDDLDGIIAAMGSANYATIVAEDESNFLDRAKTTILLTEERHEVWANK
jgi:uncharacterized protein (TIGR02118 family)